MLFMQLFPKILGGIANSVDPDQTDQIVEHCSAEVKRQIQDQQLAGSTTASTKFCGLEQDTSSTLLCTGFYPERPAKNAHKDIGSN